MKRITAAALAFLMLFVCAVTAYGETNSFRLMESTASIFGGENLIYMSDQQMYHFTAAGDASVELSVKSGLYFYIIAGSDYSPPAGTAENGTDSGCTITVECLNENGELTEPYYAVLNVPADHVFHRYSLGKDTMYAGLPDDVCKVRVKLHAYDSRQYIRAMEILSSDARARDLSLTEWEEHTLGNINAQTTKADYWLMAGFVAAVAVIMLVFAKTRDKIRKDK